MTALAFYAEQGIPKVRWMYPGKAYKARLITVPRKYEQAKMYIYVLNDKYVIAYRDEQLTQEIGMLRLRDFEMFGHLKIDSLPVYESRCPISLTYGMLFDVAEPVESVIEKPKSVTKMAEMVAVEPKIDIEVKVSILPPEPPVVYEQLALF